MTQSVFEFEPNNDYSPQNFLVSSSNKDAFEIISNKSWNSYAANIFGPAASGKTYLANILLSKNPDAKIIDDLDSGANEELLLHTLNSCKEEGVKLLITSEQAVAKLDFSLADLTSRLKAVETIEIKEPDQELLYMVLARQFDARQLKVSDDVLNYITTRIERSFEAANNAVEKIDKLSLQEKRNITIPLVKNVIG